MASILKILRRIGGVKAPPTTGSAGELALWKAGAGPNDFRALYAHDGTQWVPMVDYASATLPGVAAFATKAEMDAMLVTDKIVTPGMLREVIRERLFANRIYYVRPDGADTNTGLADTPAGAFKTIQRAVDMTNNIDMSGFSLKIKVADGAYTPFYAMKPFIGGNVTIEGNITTPSAVTIHGAGVPIKVFGGAQISLSGFSLSSTNNACLSCSNPGSVVVVTGPMEFLSAKAAMVNVNQFAQVNMTAANISIGGTATQFILANGASTIFLDGCPVTFAAGTTFTTAFVQSIALSSIVVARNTWTGTFTGPRYYANTNAVIMTNGASATAFPGTVAGSVATGGLYV